MIGGGARKARIGDVIGGVIGADGARRARRLLSLTVWIASTLLAQLLPAVSWAENLFQL